MECEPAMLDCAECGRHVAVGHQCGVTALQEALLGMLVAYLSGTAGDTAARHAVAVLREAGVDVDARLYNK